MPPWPNKIQGTMTASAGLRKTTKSEDASKRRARRIRPIMAQTLLVSIAVESTQSSTRLLIVKVTGKKGRRMAAGREGSDPVLEDFIISDWWLVRPQCGC